MAEAFTFFEKFGDVCSCLNEDDCKELMYAICKYGSCGEEVELPYMLKAIFVSLKEDIDNSKNMRARGAKGGRPSKKQQVGEVIENEKPECEIGENQDGVLVRQPCKPVVSVGSQKNESQSNPNQSKPSQSKRKGTRFAPPSLQEVRDYCAEKGYTFDPEAFWSFYESKGWKVGRDPMKSWTAACVTWQKRETKNPEGGTHDEYSNL